MLGGLLFEWRINVDGVLAKIIVVKHFSMVLPQPVSPNFAMATFVMSSELIIFVGQLNLFKVYCSGSPHLCLYKQESLSYRKVWLGAGLV